MQKGKGQAREVSGCVREFRVHGSHSDPVLKVLSVTCSGLAALVGYRLGGFRSFGHATRTLSLPASITRRFRVEGRFGDKDLSI